MAAWYAFHFGVALGRCFPTVREGRISNINYTLRGLLTFYCRLIKETHMPPEDTLIQTGVCDVR